MPGPRVPEADALRAVREAKYVQLTTFKRDGTAVPTPVWSVEDAGALLVWTARESGKVKRIRRSGEVTVAPCTMRGKVTGATVSGRAELLDTAGTIHLQDALGRKYGWLGRLFVRRAVRRGGQDAAVGIRITLTP